MANEFGPTGVRFEIDSYDAGANTVGALTALPRITECNGVNASGITVDLTSFEDVIRNDGLIGRLEIARIMLKGYMQLNEARDAVLATSASKVLGLPQLRTDVPPRTFKLTYIAGVSRAVEVEVVKNDPVPSLTVDLMFDCELAIRARAAGDYVQEGF